MKPCPLKMNTTNNDTSKYACRCGNAATWERMRQNGEFISRDYWCDECKSIEDGTLLELGRGWSGILTQLLEDNNAMYCPGCGEYKTDFCEYGCCADCRTTAQWRKPE